MIHQIIMFIKYVKARRCSLIGAVLVQILLHGALASGQVPRNVIPLQLYLLSGTPTNYGEETFPVCLYRVNAAKLKLVREVVPQTEGLYSVHTSRDVIFVAHPHIVPTTASIIHASDPLRADDVVFNPKSLITIGEEVLAEPKPALVDELFALATDPTQLNKGTLVSVSSSLAATDPRLKYDKWEEYSALRFDGVPGGPAPGTGPFGSIVGERFVISIFGHNIAVEALPPFHQGINGQTIAWFVAVNREYSVLALANTAPALPTEKAGILREMLVHERVQDRWKKIQIEGSNSRLRLFGPWLAIIVGTENPDHKPSPGRENERGSKTDRLPNVREAYATFAGYESWLPGILVLQNLADGRKIRIETGQEDSEVLRVEGDIVLYRINDTIYQAKIVGDQLKDSTVVVKDEDVPEIHWVFWSP
jgi:hypothetical protein